MTQPYIRGRRKVVFLAILYMFFLVFWAAVHWKYFFPIDNRTDLSFQLTGELISFATDGLAFAVLIFLTSNEETKKRFEEWPRFVRYAVGVFPYGVGMIAINWRDNFDGHRFQAFSLLGNILIWMICGPVFGFLLSGRHTDAPIEDESTA